MLIDSLTWEESGERIPLPNAAPPGWIRQWCCPDKSVAVVTDPVGGGQYALRLQLDPGDQGDQSSNSCRAEMSPPNPEAASEDRTERWYGFSLYLPLDF